MQEDKPKCLRKGVFPYIWATSVEQLRNADVIPNRECFYNELREEEISDEDYDHACDVFNHFECENMLEYCELILRFRYNAISHLHCSI